MKNTLSSLPAFRRIATVAAALYLGIGLMVFLIGWAAEALRHDRSTFDQVFDQLIGIATFGRSFWAMVSLCAIGSGMVVVAFTMYKVTEDEKPNGGWRSPMGVMAICGLAVWLAGGVLVFQTFEGMNLLNYTQFLALFVFVLPVGFMVAVNLAESAAERYKKGHGASNTSAS